MTHGTRTKQEEICQFVTLTLCSEETILVRGDHLAPHVGWAAPQTQEDGLMNSHIATGGNGVIRMVGLLGRPCVIWTPGVSVEIPRAFGGRRAPIFDPTRPCNLHKR